MNQLTLEGKKAIQIKPIVKRKGTITIDFLTYDDNSEKHLKKFREKNIPLPKINGFSVDFDGWNEGSGSPCKDEEEVKKQVKHLIQKHKENYNLEVIDKRIKETKIYKEEIKKDLCEDCGKKEKVWDIEIRNKCGDCLRQFYLNAFELGGVGKEGFIKIKEGYKFYSHTTEQEKVKKENVLAVFNGVAFPTKTFPFCIWICDEFGTHEHTFGITKEFADCLIKELKLKKEPYDNRNEEEGFVWKNPKIKQDEKSKRIAELKKELAVKKSETMKVIKQIRELEDAN